MPSSTSLYSSTPGNANVASQNFTTLYSGSGTINPQQAYGNANVVALLATSTDGGNTIGNISATGNVTADYFIGNFQGNITGNINVTGANTEVLFNNAGNVGTAAGFTFVNTTGNLAVPGNVSAVGNVTGNYILGNGSQLTGLPATYGNANVVSLLASFGSNTISTTGNVTAGYFVGNGAALTSIAGANVTGTVANATYALNANAATFAGTVTTNAQPNITSVGILTAINTSGNVSATGNITGNYFLGNGSQLTGLPATYGNANVAANLAAFATNPISTSGNITAGYFFGNGSGLTDINAGNIIGAYGNANVANFLANGFGSNTITTTGNITAGNINTANYVAFGTTGAQTTAATGQMFWDTTEQTVSLGMNNGVTQQIGLEQYVLVKASSAITDGQAVMFTGAAGDNIQAAPADTTSVGFRPEYIIGVATQSIALNAFGYITTFGKVRGLNTNAFTVGDILWVDNATPGALTNTRPTDPNFQIEVAAVTKKSGGDGHILVRVTPFNSLDSLTDVTITTPSTGQALVYSGNVWVNGNPQLANTANTVTNNAQANITSVGTLTSLSVSGNVDGGNLRTAGQVTATGNITGGNVIVPINGRYYGDFTSGTASGRTMFQTTATGTSSATSLAAIPGPNHVVSNTGFSSQMQLFADGANIGNSSFSRLQQFGNRFVVGTSAAGTGTAGNIQITAGSAQIWLLTTGNVGIANTNPQHSLAVSGTAYVGGALSVTGNITADSAIVTPTLYANTIGDGGLAGTGNIAVQAGNVAVSGNVTVTKDLFANTITAGAFVSTPALYTSDLTPPGGGPLLTTTSLSTISGNLSVTGTITGSGNITGGNLLTGGLISATGNINGANLVAAANLTSTQQTVVGTANIAGGTGNIIISGKNIATDMAFLPDGGNAATAVNGRIVVGTGWNGNISHSAVQNRLLVQDTVLRGDTTTNTQFFASDPIVSLTGNVTNNSFRVQGIGSRVRIGGGPAGNIMSGAFGVGSVGSVAALQPNIDVGNISPYFLGNTVVTQATLNGGFILPATGSTVNNAYGMIPGLNAGGGNIVNYIGFASQLNGMSSGSVTGNVYGVYHGSNTTINTTGIGTNNIVRSAPGYYAFYNADTVAQVQLGSLRSYNEFQYPTANTSGTVNIDKNNAQVQYIAPTANVTIGNFQNFVTNANDGTNNDAQTDTVTLIIKQGATPYTVTMPTGNASIKYAGGISTIGSTANSVTMASITAANVAGAALYMVTISPEFS